MFSCLSSYLSVSARSDFVVDFSILFRTTRPMLPKSPENGGAFGCLLNLKQFKRRYIAQLIHGDRQEVGYWKKK